MGTIYKVRHRLLDEIRVIKVMRSQLGADEELKQRFTLEAKTLTRLRHPNIGEVIDFALDADGTAYIVMEFIDGVNLSELLKVSGPPGLALTLDIAHQALLALGYLHRKNIVHRDVAPDNLMVTLDEEHKPHVKLIDLGIAKALDRTVELTSTGVFLGKVKYCSPEQLGGVPKGETLDGRSDLYSLGIVLYQVLTGQLPFAGESPRELFAAHLFKPPAPFSETDPNGLVPEEARVLVLKALEKKRDDRFATAEEFDREILALRSRFGGADDPDATMRLLTKVRGTPEISRETVTPSAQERLNLQFLSQTTPSRHEQSSLTAVPTVTRSAGRTAHPAATQTPSAEAAPAELRPAPPTIGEAPAPKPRRALFLLLAAGALAVVLAVLLFRPSPQEGTGPTSVRPTAAPVIRATPVPRPTSPPRITPQATPMASEQSAAEASGQMRPAAEVARSRASTARFAAERAGAPELASKLYDRARRKQSEGLSFFGREDYAAAQEAFASATQLFENAGTSASSAPKRSTQPPVVVAQIQPTAQPEPVRPAATLPRPEPARPPTAPPKEVRNEAFERERMIRETIRRYEKALNTLDVDLHTQVYPSVERGRIQAAWDGLRSQAFEFEIREIRNGGTRAEVHGYEKRVAVPRIGSEQRFSGERVIQLEKRRESWVIVGLK